jgi:ATP-dependent Clp protease ATP-binding subunit ClpA
MYERFTEVARWVMQKADEEARRYNHEYIGTEHLLLGLLKAPFQRPARILEEFDIDPLRVRLEIERIIKQGPNAVGAGELLQTPRTRKAIEYAIKEARNLHQDAIGPEHVLLGLLCEEECVASVVLCHLGLKRDELRDYLRGNRKARPAKLREQELRLREQELLSGLPEEVQQQVRELDVQIVQLTIEKEEAVRVSDFEKAADLRDQADGLRKKRHVLIREAHEKQPKPGEQ